MGVMQPENPLVGGTVLRRAAIRSPNFVTGSAGWTINQDGSAEFNNIVIRNGQVISGTALYYSGTPAAGNLIASISAAGGTDSLGNVYLAGEVVYQPSGATLNYATGVNGHTLTFWTGPSGSKGAGPWTAVATFGLDSTGTILLLGGPSGGTSLTGGLAADFESLTAARAAGILLDINNGTAAPAAANLRITSAAAGDRTLALQVNADTATRLLIDATGKHSWGSGAAVQDTTLYRNGVSLLKTDGELDVGGILKALAGLSVVGGETADTVAVSSGQAGGNVLQITNTTAAPTGASTRLIAAAAADRLLALQVTGDTVTRLLVDSNGKILWGPGGAAAQDTDLFRGGVGILQTDSALAITNQASPGALAGAAQLYAASGQPAYRNPAGLLANLSGSQLGVVTQNTVTQAAFTNLASATIPAGDAEIGAVYKVTAFGSGVWGSTQQQLTFGARFGAAQTNVVGTNPAIAATALAASAAFEWWAEVIAVNVTTGVTGTWQVLIRGEVTQTLNAILPGTAADNTIGFAGGTTAAAPATLDSTIAELLGVSAKWAATTGAPTLTKTASFFERIA